MEIHYFQRYSQRENVITINTMLLLQRLYYYSQEKFDNVLTKLMENKEQDFNINIQWQEQIGNGKSVPDAQIRQNSFNILIETKRGKNFDIERQIKAHIDSFDGKDKYQIMLTLSPCEMDANQEEEIAKMIKRKKNTYHVHATFKKIIQLIDEEIDKSRDYEFYEILNDYQMYCSQEGILNNEENLLRVVPTGASYDDNIKTNIYYQKSEHGYTDHKYLGLYTNKEIRNVGEIKYIVDVNMNENKFTKIKGKGELTKELKDRILDMIKIAKENRHWDIENEHRFFIVDKFYETSFRKVSKGGTRNHIYFNIESEIGRKPQNAKDLAEALKDKEWS